jgi:hypothetical protein
MNISFNVATVIVQIVVAAFVYGRLTERVKTHGDRTADHGRRISNIETVLTGTGGHGERLTALEAWRIEARAKQ